MTPSSRDLLTSLVIEKKNKLSHKLKELRRQELYGVPVHRAIANMVHLLECYTLAEQELRGINLSSLDKPVGS